MENFPSGRFRMRQASERVTEPGKAFLHVQGNGVIDFGSDTQIRKVLFEGIAPTVGDSDSVLVPNMPTARILMWQLDRLMKLGVSEQLGVPMRVLLPSGSIGIEVGKFYEQESRLQSIETRIDSQQLVMITRLHAMGSEQAQPRCQFLILADHHAPVSHSAKVLGRIKAQTSYPSHASCRVPSPCCADGLSRILNEGQLMLGSDFLKGVHGSALPE
jgi:hypothetical protein